MVSQIIIIACWLIFLLYFWLWRRVFAQSIKSAQRTKIRFAGVWFVPIRLGMFFLLAETFGYFHVPFLRDILFPRFPVLVYIGVVCAIVGLGVAITARRALSSNWSFNVDIKHDHELITSGVYAHVRHPIYAGLIFLALGTLLESAKVSALIFLLILLAFLLFKLRTEEVFLAEQFPEQYPSYRKRTKALLPFIW